MSSQNINLRYFNRFVTISTFLIRQGCGNSSKMTPVGTALHFRRENENLSSSADVLHKTKNLAISRCCFADDGKEMDKSEKPYVQSVQSYCFYPLNMQNRDVLVAVAVV